MEIWKKSDEELIKSYQSNNDQQIVQTLHARYETQIFRLCMYYLKNAQEAEDASVDIYIELTKKLKTSNVSNFKSWLYVVCKNHALKKLRGKSRALMAEDTFSHLRVKSNGSQDHINKLLEMLPDAINHLNEDQRWCIVLFYLHNKSYKEIEKIRGYDFKKVKSSIMHGKKKLLKFLEMNQHESI